MKHDIKKEVSCYNPWETSRQELNCQLSKNGFTTDNPGNDTSEIIFSKANNLLEFHDEVLNIRDHSSLILFKNDHYTFLIRPHDEGEKLLLELIPSPDYTKFTQSHTKDQQEREIIMKFVEFVRFLLGDQKETLLTILGH